MANFKDDILKCLDKKCNGEHIQKILVNSFFDAPVNWNEVKDYLDYEYDDGFGGTGCDAIYAWTENFFVGVSEYDGATGLDAYPRNPINCEAKYL